MNIAFRTAVSGMMGAQRDMDVTANNIANVNTTAFKSSRASFSELLYTKIDYRDDDGRAVGHGTRVANVDVMHTQGGYHSTANPLDFSIIGDGFFAVQAQNGDTQYTRSGIFKVSQEDKKNFLVTSDGRYVLDARGRKIELPLDMSKLDAGQLKDSIGVYIFPNPSGLEPVGSSTYRQTDRSGTPTEYKRLENTTTVLQQYAIEDSNVDLATEMANVIMSQRAFQLNARVVQTADQLDEVINSLR